MDKNGPPYLNRSKYRPNKDGKDIDSISYYNGNKISSKININSSMREQF